MPRAVGAIIVAADGFHTRALQLRQIRRDIEVEVDDLRAVGSQSEPLAGLRKPRDGASAPAARRTERLQHLPARKHPIPNWSRITHVATWNPSLTRTAREIILQCCGEAARR